MASAENLEKTEKTKQPNVASQEQKVAATAQARTYPDQCLKVYPEAKRSYGITVPSWDDVTPDKSVSVVAYGQRHSYIEPMTIIDKAGLVPDDILTYAKGRDVKTPPACATFSKKVKISGRGLILSHEDEIYPESCIREHHAYYQKDRQHVDVSLHVATDRIMQRVKEPTLILTGVFPLHFSHWLYDNFAKLMIAKTIFGDLSNFKVAVGFGDRAGGWLTRDCVQFQCLKALGIKFENVSMLPQDRWTIFDQAIILSEVNNFRPPTRTVWNAPEIFDFFRAMYRDCGLPLNKPTRHVHLSRTDNTNRKCVNEQEIIDHALSIGMEEKIIAGMTMKEQMQYFSEIKVAVGPVGNNLLTMCFMQPGTKLIVYFPSIAWHIIPYYQNFCSAGGIELIAVCATKAWETDEKPGLDGVRWEANVESLKQLIDVHCLEARAQTQTTNNQPSLVTKLMEKIRN